MMKVLTIALMFAAASAADPPAAATEGAKTQAEIMTMLGSTTCEYVLSGKKCDKLTIDDREMLSVLSKHADLHFRGDKKKATAEFCNKVSLVLQKTREKPPELSAKEHCEKIFEGHGSDAMNALKEHVVLGKIRKEEL